MLLQELLLDLNYTQVINKTEVNTDTVEIISVCCDSRKAYKDSLFVCISGSLSDGHDYAVSAYNKMCRVFIAQREIPELPEDAVVFIVPDTRIALANISDRFFGHPSGEMRIIAVTGTKGKTTSSLLIYNILNASGIPTGYIGSNGVSFDDYHFNTVNTCGIRFFVESPLI